MLQRRMRPAILLIALLLGAAAVVAADPARYLPLASIQLPSKWQLMPAACRLPSAHALLLADITCAGSWLRRWLHPLCMARTLHGELGMASASAYCSLQTSWQAAAYLRVPLFAPDQWAFSNSAVMLPNFHSVGWYVSIGWLVDGDWGSICGGMLISQTHVLTAAHVRTL